ncbi:MAG: hypothetical protein Q9199_006047 [Rusavskia elegans]
MEAPFQSAIGHGKRWPNCGMRIGASVVSKLSRYPLFGWFNDLVVGVGGSHVVTNTLLSVLINGNASQRVGIVPDPRKAPQIRQMAPPAM